MIPTPRRSVTRFFIPMIDVLTLLFCIFLLMPYVQPGEGGPQPGTPAEDAGALRREVDRLARERDGLARDRDGAVRSQAVCVLEIDSISGKLYERGPARVEIANQADAFAVVERTRAQAPGREVYVLILYPSVVSGYPEQRQIAAFERWFAGVPHGYDRPFARGAGR
ncbi:MAG: hypothetical protein K1X57_04045 [Gemmataceae bacterium]|nr:hypothetical protein [Gemmataceae bacterium]